MFHHDENGSSYSVDSFCPEAAKLAGRKGLCTECPFRECILSMKSAEKGLILQASIIQQAYASYDTGHDLKEIAQILDITYSKIYNWLHDRPRIEKKIRTYAAV
jgi:transposase-like protein